MVSRRPGDLRADIRHAQGPNFASKAFKRGERIP
jgi:hypothetical protein